jgi:hypothetical protein
MVRIEHEPDYDPRQANIGYRHFTGHTELHLNIRSKIAPVNLAHELGHLKCGHTAPSSCQCFGSDEFYEELQAWDKAYESGWAFDYEECIFSLKSYLNTYSLETLNAINRKLEAEASLNKREVEYEGV